MPEPNQLVVPCEDDYRDLVITDLAAGEAEAQEAAGAWEAVAKQAIHLLARQRTEIAQLRRTTASQRDQLRDLLAEQPRLTEELQRLRGFLVRQTQGAA